MRGKGGGGVESGRSGWGVGRDRRVMGGGGGGGGAWVEDGDWQTGVGNREKMDGIWR